MRRWFRLLQPEPSRAPEPEIFLLPIRVPFGCRIDGCHIFTSDRAYLRIYNP